MTERLKILSKYSFPEKPSYGSNKCDKWKHYFSINHIWKHTKGCRKELLCRNKFGGCKTGIK